MLRDSVVEDFKAQVVLLQRRIKYLQSVGTVFRQKIALIVRECARNPSGAGSELQRLYSQALGEISQVEEDLVKSDQSATTLSGSIGGQGGGMLAADGSYNSFVLAGRTPRTAQAKEDARKAHHLCMILQEKNELKERELALKRSLDTLKSKFDDLDARHRRVLELQSSMTLPAGGGASVVSTQAHLAQRELYESRIHELEEALISTKTDLVRLRSSSVGHNHNSTHEDGSGHNGSNADAASVSSFANSSTLNTDVPTVQKQNIYLRSRIQKLKDDVQSLKASSVGSTLQLQQSLDSLLRKIDEQNKKIETQGGSIRTLEQERVSLHRDLSVLRQQNDALTQQLTLSAEQSARALRIGGGATAGSDLAAAGGDDASGGTNLRSAITEYQQQIAHLEDAVTALRDQLREERRVTNDKSLEIRSLGVQIQSLRTKVDTLQSHEEQRLLQQTVVNDVQSRIVGALREIQESQNASQLSARVQEMSEKLRLLESVEMQLRQKEDQLAVAEDEILQLRSARDELHLSLSAISSLFMQLPSSIGQVESLVLELREYKKELRASYDEHRVPDLVRIEAAVELQVLEAKAAKTSQQALRDEIDKLSAGGGGGGGLTTGDGADHNRAELADEELAQLLTFPPPPPLINLLGDVGSGGGGGGANGSPPRTSKAASPFGAGAASPGSAFGFNSPSGGPGTESDVILTFQLFDEAGVGALPSDVLKLCLATLGITKRLPIGTASMAQHEFLSFCMS